jgi:hypothetical protein
MSPSVFSAYFDDIEQQLLRLPNLYAEQFNVTILTAKRANLKLRLRFKGRYLLAISEALQIVNDQITQIDYRYHFQDEDNQVIFRYDSTPHFPDLPTFPHHKHLPNTVISAYKPDITQVLQEASAFAEAQN